MPATVGAENQQPTFLRGIANQTRVDKRHWFRDLSRCLHAELLLHGWQALNQDAASGVDNGTADAHAEHLHAPIVRHWRRA